MVLILVGFPVAHGPGEHAVDDLLNMVHFAGRRSVGEDVGARHRLGQQRVALHRPVELAHHEVQPVVRSAAADGRAVGLGINAFELPTQGGHQEVNLRREVPVQRSDRHIRAICHRAHLNRFEAPLGGDSQRRVEDALAPFTLGLGAQFRFG